MPLLHRHDPPSHLRDLAGIPDGFEQWHRYITRTLADAADNIAALKLQAPAGGTIPPRFYDATVHDPGQPVFEVPILWNAFPRRLLSRFGRDKAMVLADMLWPLAAAAVPEFDPLSPQYRAQMAAAGLRGWMRPQDEYCEWRVERDEATQRIRRITFTVESPEYWTALHGGDMDTLRDAAAVDAPPPFIGRPELAAALYGGLLGQPVVPTDLLDRYGRYNPYNLWNTTRGIVHLTHPVNALCTQIRLCADSTLACRRPDGSLITHPEALCCAQPNGDPNTHSDPTIIGTVNALARRGAWLTLANPIGVSMADVDTNGWTWADGTPATGCLHAVRGAPGRILRLVVEPPAGSRHALGELYIGGEPLQHGGQVAECITIQAMALCALPGMPQPVAAIAPARRAHLTVPNPLIVATRSQDTRWEAGFTPAFVETSDQGFAT